MFGKAMAPVLLAAALAASAVGARADSMLPTGLAPGSQYEIAFVTSDGTNAESSSILTYNDFVTAEANEDSVLAGLGVQWHAIASTDTAAAKDNAPFSASIPVYNTAGQLVADAADPLYGGTLLNAIDTTQSGKFAWLVLTGPGVWTGSYSNGTIRTGEALGDKGQGEYPIFGYCSDTNVAWLWYRAASADTTFSLYALSSPITVVPEPSTFALLVAGAIGLIGCAWRRRRG